MGNALAALQLGGTVLSTQNKLGAANALQRQGYDIQAGQEAQARNYVEAAGQKRAESQYKMRDVAKQGKLMESALRARAAAQPGGMSGNPTTMNIAGDLAAEIEYRKQAAIYGGDAYAKALMDQANMSRWTGEQYARAGEAKARSTRMGAYGGLLGQAAENTLVQSAGKSIYDKYGETFGRDNWLYQALA